MNRDPFVTWLNEYGGSDVPPRPRTEIVRMVKVSMVVEVVAVQTPENAALIIASKDKIAEAVRAAVLSTVERLLRGGATIEGVATEAPPTTPGEALTITLEVPGGKV